MSDPDLAFELAASDGSFGPIMPSGQDVTNQQIANTLVTARK
jgi:hypothetical protein